MSKYIKFSQTALYRPGATRAATIERMNDLMKRKQRNARKAPPFYIFIIPDDAYLEKGSSNDILSALLKKEDVRKKAIVYPNRYIITNDNPKYTIGQVLLGALHHRNPDNVLICKIRTTTEFEDGEEHITFNIDYLLSSDAITGFIDQLRLDARYANEDYYGNRLPTSSVKAFDLIR